MNHPLHTKIIFPFTPLFWRVKALYEASFPVQERISWPWMVWMALLGQADFLAYYDGQNFAGFSYSLRSKTSYYLFFWPFLASINQKDMVGRFCRQLQVEQGKGRFS